LRAAETVDAEAEREAGVVEAVAEVENETAEAAVGALRFDGIAEAGVDDGRLVLIVGLDLHAVGVGLRLPFSGGAEITCIVRPRLVVRASTRAPGGA